MAADFNPAKRGDLVVVTVSHTAYYVHGPRETYETHHAMKVASVTRDGRVKLATRPDGCPTPCALKSDDWTRCTTAPRAAFGDVDAVLLKLGADADSDDLPELVNRLRALRVATV